MEVDVENGVVEEVVGEEEVEELACAWPPWGVGVGVEVDEVVDAGVMFSSVSMDATSVPIDWAIWVAFIPWLLS